MKKIITKEEKEKRETRNKVIIGLILVAIMILSTAGYAFFSSPEEKKEKIEYNGIKFTLNENGLWQFKIQDFEFLTQYNPKETENISVPILMTLNYYSGKPLYLLGESPAKQEISRNLWDFLSRIPQEGCIVKYKELCEENAPIKNCSEDNIIIIKEGNYTEIRQEDNCIFIFSPYQEQTRATDAFIFKILGVREF